MLIEFSVENFRSIKEKVTLSMVASGYKELEENVISLKKPKEMRLLKSAVIYGANASGKSNVVRAFEFMVYFIRISHKMQINTPIDIHPFMLDEEYEKKESSFEITFIHKGVLYVYGFSVNKKRVTREYLYFYPKLKRNIIFERKMDKFKFTKDIALQNKISERTLPNALYLSISTQMNYERTRDAFEWFEKVHTITPNSIGSMLAYSPLFDIFGLSSLAYLNTIKLMEDERIKNAILKIIKKADIAIEDIEIENKIEDMEAMSSKDGLKAISQMEINFVHKRNAKEGGTEKIKFDLQDESDGTKKLFRILAPWVDSLINGKLIVIDELDMRLHPLLTDMLVRMFNSRKHNKKNAQLIFTTHNTYLMKRDFFRKDQIWFTEKKVDQSTDLYSLYDVKGVRKTENIEKGYLLGRYGGIPFIYIGDIEL